jgi:Ca2+-binding RTX toxin-like protein
MNESILRGISPRVMGTLALVLAATLASLLTISILAKPSHAADPILTVNETDIGFGAVEVGTTGDPVRTITIRNTTGTEVVLGGINLLGTNAGDFALVNPLPVGGVTLDRDGTYSFDVSFTPTANGTRLAELGFDVVGGGATVPTVNLTGTGVNEPPSSQPGVESDCTIIGTNNGERITGTPANDVICSLGGSDRVNGLGGNDRLRGGTGNDRLTDKAGKDKLFGESGKDRMSTRDGKRGDLLVGGSGRDRAAKDKRDKARSI